MWVFPTTLGESAWTTPSERLISFFNTFQSSVWNETPLLPSLTAQSRVGRLHVLIAAAHVDPSVAVDEHQHTALPDTTFSLSRCAPCPTSRPRAALTLCSLQGKQKWLRWGLWNTWEFCCCSLFTCVLIKALQICISLRFFPAYLLAQHCFLLKKMWS